MAGNDLKKLNRYQLLQLLVAQTERADELEKKVEELEKRLEERELNFSRLGSVAEAAVQISGVFEAAQNAAELYLESVKKEAEEMLVYARRKADEIIAVAEKKAAIITDVQQEENNETIQEET
ncbi:MAG: hypothetical protein IKM61_00035 [Eubacteriaceae bacterium]|nr:hypothetical protein [Eubacteriaceae bacterium]